MVTTRLSTRFKQLHNAALSVGRSGNQSTTGPAKLVALPVGSTPSMAQSLPAQHTAPRRGPTPILLSAPRLLVPAGRPSRQTIEVVTVRPKPAKRTAPCGGIRLVTVQLLVRPRSA